MADSRVFDGQTLALQLMRLTEGSTSSLRFCSEGLSGQANFLLTPASCLQSSVVSTLIKTPVLLIVQQHLLGQEVLNLPGGFRPSTQNHSFTRANAATADVFSSYPLTEFIFYTDFPCYTSLLRSPSLSSRGMTS